MFNNFLYIYANLMGFIGIVCIAVFHTSHLIDRQEYLGAIISFVLWIILGREGFKRYICCGTAWDAYRKIKVFDSYRYIFVSQFLASIYFDWADWVDLVIALAIAAVVAGLFARTIEKSLPLRNLRYMQQHSWADWSALIEEDSPKAHTKVKK